MKLLHRCLVFGAIALGVSSCSQEAPWGATGNGEGSIKLNLTTSGFVTKGAGSTRATTEEVAVPKSELFSIRISKADGSQAKTYETLQDFIDEKSFEVGSYYVEAFYGSPDDQGLAGVSGYDNAYFYGKSQLVTVVEGSTSTVELSAELCNSAIQVEYTDEFKNYFANWSTTFASSENTAVDFGQSETMGYITPGEVDVIISATFQNGKTTRLKPASFAAVPKHLYKVKYDVYKGEVGNAVLEVSFDDSVEEEDVIIEISADDIANSAAPEVTTNITDAFGNLVENGGTVASQMQMAYPGDIKFNVVARGGIKEGKLKVTSSNYTSMFGKEIDLCSADAQKLQQVASAGIDAVGFKDADGKMAHVNLSGLCANLPEGVHTVSLTVTDNLGRVSEPMEITIASEPVETEVMTATAPFGEGYADITLNYNGNDPTMPGANPFSFKTVDITGISKQCEIVSVKLAPDTRSEVFAAKQYVYRVRIPEIEKDEFDVNVYFGGASTVYTVAKVKFEYPDYEIETDALATSVRFRLKSTDANKSALYAKRLVRNVSINGETKTATLDNATNILTVTGLQAGQNYTLTTSSSVNASLKSMDTAFTTEEATQIPNGDFSETGKNIYFKDLQAGGIWYVAGSSWYEYKNYATINKWSPANWADLNDLTAWNGSENKNTWFVVPSTYLDDNSVLIRTVGYNHNGDTPTKGVSSVNNYYCPNTPKDGDLVKTAGELFLGTYSFNGSEERENGIAFTSRPAAISFDYSYKSVNNEVGEAVIRLIADSGEALYETVLKLDATSDFTTKELSIANYAFGKKAASI